VRFSDDLGGGGGTGTASFLRERKNHRRVKEKNREKKDVHLTQSHLPQGLRPQFKNAKKR